MGNIVAFSKDGQSAPMLENGKVTTPRRKTNAEVRPREYLTADEVERLMKAAGSIGRHRHRDRTIILMAYRHGLRVSELIALQWSHVDFKTGSILVNRIKNGINSTQRLQGPQLRALRRLKREYPDSPYLFTTERGGPITAATVRKMLARAGQRAELGIKVHPHMLRHATGYYLANEGIDTRSIQHYLGHRNISHTVRYTDLSSKRFEGLWKD